MKARHNQQGYFHVADYCVLAVSLTISLAVGIGQGCCGKARTSPTPEHYLMGGRHLAVGPVSISMVVSFISSLSLIGGTAEVYVYGIQIAADCVGMVIGGILAMLLFVPLLHPLRLISAQQYLERRYGSRSVRYLGSFMSVLFQLLYGACVTFGQATALEAGTGLASWMSIVLVICIGTVYTSIGGIRAVVLTDVFQSGIILCSVLAVVIQGIIQVGGFGALWSYNKAWDRLQLDWSGGFSSRLSIISLVIGSSVTWFSMFGVSQSAVQRYSALRTSAQGQRAIQINTVGMTIIILLTSLTGMVAFAYYAAKGCDPLISGDIANGNQILPYLVSDILWYPGLPGLFLSGLFSGSLSTLSSCLNAVVAVCWEDFLQHRCRHLSPRRQVTVLQVAAVVFGMVCLGASFVVPYVGGSLAQVVYSFLGGIVGPLLGLFLLGAAFPFANWKGALVGGITSLSIVIWLLLGQMISGRSRDGPPSPHYNCSMTSLLNNTETQSASITSGASGSTYMTPAGSSEQMDHDKENQISWLVQLYSISFPWFSVIGLVLCLTIGGATSLLTGRQKNIVDDVLLFPCVRTCRQPPPSSSSQLASQHTDMPTGGACADQSSETHELGAVPEQLKLLTDQNA